MKDFLYNWFLMLIGSVVGVGACYFVHDCNTSTLAGTNSVNMEVSQGMASSIPTEGYIIVIATDKQAYVNGEPIEPKPLQKLLGVKQDGKIGPVTINKVIEFNRLDEIK